jgi:GDP-L-fucose synthase
MKILLTGATGFLGQNLLPALQQNHTVVAPLSQKTDLREQSTCKYIVDVHRPDIIIHAAGTVGGIGANRENPGKFMYENLIMGINMIHSAMVGRVKKFILLGTVCSYPKFTEVPFKEEDLWLGYPEETNAPYGIAKKTLMRLVEAYHEQYGLNGINLLPVNMYGPHDHFNLTDSHVIPAMILKVHKAKLNNDDQIILWGTGQASREFLYVKDCVRAIELAIEKNPGPEPINIGTGQEIKICELIETIADIMEFDGKIVYNTSYPDGQPRRCLDVTRATERLNFTVQTALKEGLLKTINWFLQGENLRVT